MKKGDRVSVQKIINWLLEAPVKREVVAWRVLGNEERHREIDDWTLFETYANDPDEPKLIMSWYDEDNELWRIGSAIYISGLGLIGSWHEHIYHVEDTYIQAEDSL